MASCLIAKEIKMNYYNIEVTDLYAGELNYSWVKRYTTKAKSVRGAIQKLSRHVGNGHTFADGYGDDWAVYHSVTGCIGVTINFIDCEERQKGESI